MFLLQLHVSPAETSGMQLEPLKFEHSFGAAGSDGQLPSLDLGFLELPERVLTQPCTKALSVASWPVYPPEGKRTTFADRCSGYTFAM